MIQKEYLKRFAQQLAGEEKSPATIEKYLRDVKTFVKQTNNRAISREILIEYKESLAKSHSIISANSMIASLNAFLRFLGKGDLCLKQYRVQKKVFCPEEKELTKAEYQRLVETAKRKGNDRLGLILQTICATGIRVSELKYITAQAVKSKKAIVNCKGKTRTVFLVPLLCKKLLEYMNRKGIREGTVFVTRTGKSVDRCNIWREMKALCREAGVAPGKVFPHNLRHLFARTFYKIEKDIAKLADILGHSSINTTRIYIMTTGAEHRRKMENMRLVM